MQHIERLLKLRLNNAMKMNASQSPNDPYKPAQKILESTAFYTLSSPMLSKIHSSVPSSLICDHHLRPTKILPVKFLTTQKSKALSMATAMKTTDLPLTNNPSKM